MPTCQGQHPNGSPCRNPVPEGQSHCYIHRRLDPSAPLMREDVMAAIEEHGGPEGLDLSHENLSGIDLGQEKIRDQLRVRGLERASWYSSMTKGVDLREANLQGSYFSGANLDGANLSAAQPSRGPTS